MADFLPIILVSLVLAVGVWVISKKLNPQDRNGDESTSSYPTDSTD